MTLVPFSRTQVLRRYRTVLQVLSRYGFGYLADHLGLSRLRAGTGPDSGAAGGRGERLRRAFEELGPTFVKLGQMLSTRNDLLPPDIVAGLEKLQDQVAPFSFPQVLAVLEQQLGTPLDQRFAQFEPEPVAAASLGQVHFAVLQDGTPVAVKIQRPGVPEQVELDLQVLQGLAVTAAARTHWGRDYDLPAVAREFAAMIRGELDYIAEGHNAERFAAHFAGDDTVRFPAVHWEHTAGRVLTLERVGGLRVTDRAALQAAGLDPAAVAARLAGALFRMVLRDGFFHADPHPGNLFVTPEGVLIFVDLGMVGELSATMRENVVDYVVGTVMRDSDQVVEALLRMGVSRQAGRTTELRRAVERLQQRYGHTPLGQVEFSTALREVLGVARRFAITMPTGYMVLLKAMTTLESVARQIDPGATLIGLAAPHAELVLKTRFKPERFLAQAGRDLLDAGRFTLRIPRQVSRVLTQMEEGEWRLGLDHTGLEPALHRLSAIANRLAIAILLASLIIGTALISSGDEGSFLQDYPIADIGFIMIGAVGLWLVVSILRSGRS